MHREEALMLDQESTDICGVWLKLDPAADEALENARELLSPDEIERMARFRFDADRRLYGAAHILLRRALSRCAPDVSPAAWRFAIGTHGRPEIAAPSGHQSLRFNLSHTKGLAACVVTRGIACGIDVESHERAIDTETLAERVLAPEEQPQLAALPPHQQKDGFIRFWTLKESYAKARGLGLSLPFDKLSFRLKDGGAELLSDPTLDEPRGQWCFVQWRPTPQHIAAVALRSENRPPPDLCCDVFPSA